MIHSLAGGYLRELTYADFAKVEILSGVNTGKLFWYVTNILDLKVGDRVEVPLLNSIEQGKVVKIERNLNNQTAPVSLKRAKSIIRKIN